MKLRFIAVVSACFLHAVQMAAAAPAVEPVTYPLITNGNASVVSKDVCEGDGNGRR